MSTKIILFSDLHVHAYREFASISKRGVNTRLEDTLSVFKSIREYCKREKIDTVLFAGDLFHKRRILNVGMFNAIYDAVRAFDAVGITLLMIPGNHDQATKDGQVHSVHSLKPICMVVDEPQVVGLKNGLRVNCVPYMDDKEAFKKALDAPRPAGAEHYLLLAHGGIFGAVSGPIEYVPPEMVSAEDIPIQNYDYGFFGHYHLQQKIRERCWYIGSPLQHNRGDVGAEKGFIVYDLERKKWENIPLYLPRFVKLTQEDIVTKNVKEWDVGGNFVDVTLDVEPDGGVESFRQLLMLLGARAVAVSCVPVQKEAKNRVDVHPALSFEQMVDKYVDQYAPEELKKDALKSMVKLFMEAVEEK